MKKISFLLTITLLMLMVSCSKENQYIIKGTATAYSDGTTIYLMMRDKPEWIKVDSATVIKGKFVMRGQASPGFLGFIGTSSNDYSLIVVEKGTITIDLEDGTTHGTENNEKLTRYNDLMNNLDTQIDAVAEELQTAYRDGESDVQKYINRLDELNAEVVKILSQTISENITNPLGVGLFCMFNSAFADDINFLFDLSQQIPDEYRQQTYVSKVLENVSIIQCTAVGTHFTDLAMTTHEGRNITLDELVKSNKYVLLDFWASWCAPCRQSLPGIYELYENYADKGLCIVGISLDESREAWDAAIEKYNMKWIQVSELKGWDSKHAHAYGVRAIPATVLIDSTGMIIGRNIEANEVARIIDSDEENTIE